MSLRKLDSDRTEQSPRRRNGFISSENPVDHFEQSSSENLLRVVSSVRVGATGVFSSIKTRYLAKIRKEMADNPITSTRKIQMNSSRASMDISSTKRDLSPKYAHSTIMEKYAIMNNALPNAEDKETENLGEHLNIDLMKDKPKPNLRRVPPDRDTSAIVVCLSANNFVVQPKYMETRGSMCMCELWNHKDKQRIAKHSQDRVIDATKLPLVESSRDYIGVFRPNRIMIEQMSFRKQKENKLNMRVDQDVTINVSARKIEEFSPNLKRKNSKQETKTPASTTSIMKNAKDTLGFTERYSLMSQNSIKMKLVKSNSIASFNPQQGEDMDSPIKNDIRVDVGRVSVTDLLRNRKDESGSKRQDTYEDMSPFTQQDFCDVYKDGGNVSPEPFSPKGLDGEVIRSIEQVGGAVQGDKQSELSPVHQSEQKVFKIKRQSSLSPGRMSKSFQSSGKKDKAKRSVVFQTDLPAFYNQKTFKISLNQIEKSEESERRTEKREREVNVDTSPLK